MDSFKICISETLSRVLEVKAKSICQAIDKATDDYKNEEIILDSDDFVDYEIKELNEE